MSYTTFFVPIVAFITTILWCLDYWGVFTIPQISLPHKVLSKTAFKSRLIIFILGFVGWGFITYASFGPRVPMSMSFSNIEVNDIFIVVDVSHSMTAQDYRPNRLEVAKKKIHEFVSLRPKDRIGLIMFSEKVFTLLPLSTDLELIKKMISEIQIGPLGAGTNIGDAIGLAVGRAIQSSSKNKVIILLTDGVSNVGTMNPLKAAELAKENNIKVYTIGMGTDQNARMRGLSGGIPGGSFDDETIKKIASITGAKSFIATNEGGLTKILSEINAMERTSIKVRSKSIFKDLFLKFFAIGFVLLMTAEISKRIFSKDAL